MNLLRKMICQDIGTKRIEEFLDDLRGEKVMGGGTKKGVSIYDNSSHGEKTQNQIKNQKKTKTPIKL